MINKQSNIIFISSPAFCAYYLVDGVEERFCALANTRHFGSLEEFLEEVKDDPEVFVYEFQWEHNPDNYTRPILSVRYVVIRNRYRGTDGGFYLRCG